MQYFLARFLFEWQVVGTRGVEKSQSLLFLISTLVGPLRSEQSSRERKTIIFVQRIADWSAIQDIKPFELSVQQPLGKVFSPLGCPWQPPFISTYNAEYNSPSLVHHTLTYFCATPSRMVSSGGVASPLLPWTLNARVVAPHARINYYSRPQQGDI